MRNTNEVGSRTYRVTIFTDEFSTEDRGPFSCHSMSLVGNIQRFLNMAGGLPNILSPRDFLDRERLPADQRDSVYLLGLHIITTERGPEVEGYVTLRTTVISPYVQFQEHPLWIRDNVTRKRIITFLHGIYTRNPTEYDQTSVIIE